MSRHKNISIKNNFFIVEDVKIKRRMYKMSEGVLGYIAVVGFILIFVWLALSDKQKKQRIIVSIVALCVWVVACIYALALLFNNYL